MILHTMSTDEARRLAERIRDLADYADEFARESAFTPGHSVIDVNLWECDKLRVISHAKPTA